MTKRIASRESLSGESREISAFESFGRRIGGQGSHEELDGAAKVKHAGRLDQLSTGRKWRSFLLLCPFSLHCQDGSGSLWVALAVVT